MKIITQTLPLLLILTPTFLCQSRLSHDSESYSSCSLRSQCCNMADANCCSSGGSCYTSWKRVCDSISTDPKCSTVERKICIPVNEKSCRSIIETLYRNYPISHCMASPLQKCFKFKREVCIKKEKISQKVIRWQNEMLVPKNATTVRKCFDIKSINCATRWSVNKVRVPIKKQKDVNIITKQCSTKIVRGEDQVVQVPVTVIVNRKVCWYVPEAKCTLMKFPCGFNCPTGLHCSSTEIQRVQTVCPIGRAIQRGDHCFQLSPPACQSSHCQTDGREFNSGMAMKYANTGIETAQECCRYVSRKICRQVPTRVTKMTRKVTPGRVSARRECQDVPIKKTQFYWDYDVHTVNKSRNDCFPTVKNICVNFMVQSYDVKVNNVTDSVKVQHHDCEYQKIDDEYCHTFAEGKVVCRNTTVPKSFKIKKIKCDVRNEISKCIIIPVADCQESYAPGTCRMVPKVICPPKSHCVSDAFCIACEEFRTSIGFGSCSLNNNCPYYNSADSWNNEMVANQFISQIGGISGSLVNIQPHVTNSNPSFVQHSVDNNNYLENDFDKANIEDMDTNHKMIPIYYSEASGGPFSSRLQFSELADTDAEESINKTDE